jgi:Zn-finger protein
MNQEQNVICNGCGYPIKWVEQQNWHEVAEGQEIVLCDDCESIKEDEEI